MFQLDFIDAGSFGVVVQGSVNVTETVRADPDLRRVEGELRSGRVLGLECWAETPVLLDGHRQVDESWRGVGHVCLLRGHVFCTGGRRSCSASGSSCRARSIEKLGIESVDAYRRAGEGCALLIG